MRLFFFIFLLCSIAGFSSAQDSTSVYSITGSVAFRSDAPLELIEAKSDDLKGLIDFGNETFAFTINMSSFDGFNSALQREHFNENYMESVKYPRATFAGKMIEKVDITKDGDYVVRAKGKLNIHGVEQERIIRSLVNVKSGVVTIQSQFSVLLQEHNIGVPKVVQYKIAEEIYVDIQAKGVKK
jgi:polyisoprenoid-binding protein YceI